nr:DeoR/GlpR family DNA-binding transcription regulator [uncultured Cohaesibacter sp.]
MARNGEDRMELAEKDGKVLAQARLNWIMKKLQQDGAISVTDSAASLNVSEMTIRRDLKELEKEGLLARTHGGAVSLSGGEPSQPQASAPIAPSTFEPAFEARLELNTAAKNAIVEKAASLCGGARTIALDVGTTMFLLSRKLSARKHVKFFTNSLHNAAQLGVGNSEVYLPGGLMRSNELSLSSRAAIDQFSELWFDVAFIGVSGLTCDGIYDYSFDDAEMKRVYLTRSSHRIVLCESEKFEAMSLVHIDQLTAFDTLITEAEPKGTLKEALVAAGVDIHVASY